MPIARPLSLLVLGALIAGCSASDTASNTSLVNGKEQFVKNCGSCHVLARAGTKGTVGPNLDHAFANASDEGFGESAIRGMVKGMIDIGAATEGDKRVMRADIVTGEDARDVAAYVARSVNKKGKDTGLLATVGQAAQSKEPAVAENGTLEIPADPSGQLLYTYAEAEAPPGQLKVTMPNESTVDHNIVIDGKGEGEIVGNGGTSEFSANFTPGTYTFYCSVPGHKDGGMQGKLTVK